MAFSNYSYLFKCGLLSEGSSPSYASAPWAKEYYGPRRGSLPIDACSELTDFSAQLLSPPPSWSGQPTVESAAPSEESFYFTFKKKRNPAEHRSFLSLDLAETQSLRSISIKGKDRETMRGRRRQQTESSFFSPTFSNSFVPIFSPPPVSPPGTPISANSIPDPSHLIEPKPSSSSPQQPPTIIYAPSPRRGSHTFPTSPTSSIHTRIQRELSPMRFADPSPPPLDANAVEKDFISEKSFLSAEVLSRSSTVSSGYRRAQRCDTLKRLEGRAADGAVGRLKPRLSQNFMHLSDDEDEDEATGSWTSEKNMNVIVEDLEGEKESRSRKSSRNRESKAPGHLSVSINGQPWYNLTPRQSAWGVLFGGEADGDIDVELDQIFGLDSVPPVQPDSPQSDDSKPRKAKRSKRSYSPRPFPQKSSTVDAVPFPIQAPTRSHSPGHLHPFDPSTSTSSSSSYTTFVPKKQTSSHSNASKPSQRSLGLPERESYTRLRTVSDFGSSSPHALVRDESRNKKSRKNSHRHKPRLELRLDWLPSEQPSFIDMRDETDSRSDSWRSLFEVSCAA